MDSGEDSMTLKATTSVYRSEEGLPLETVGANVSWCDGVSFIAPTKCLLRYKDTRQICARQPFLSYFVLFEKSGPLAQ